MNPLEKSSLFWDINREELDPITHREFIVSRIFSFGNKEDVFWMKKTYTTEQLKDIFQKYEKNLDDKSRNYWFLFFRSHSVCIPKPLMNRQSTFSKR